MKKKDSVKIVEKIYHQLYAEADPSADWERLKAEGEIYAEGFFMNYILDDDRQVEIIEDILKEEKIPVREWSKYKSTILLGAAPKGKV